MAESLVLSDGTRSFDLLGDSALIYVRDGGFTLPVVSNENTYAEGSDSEGRSRVRYRATNSEAGSITVYFRGTTNALFRDAIDDLQELVVSANANKGTLAYTPPNGVEVTYDLESIQVTDMPQDGVALKNRHGEATISFEVKPFGRLASERLNVQDTYQEQVTALSPSIFLPLGASAGLTDLSGNARNGTAAGGVTVGGATGPLTVSDGGATDFDGTNDRITTTYATRRNLCTNPNFETDTAGWAVTGTGITYSRVTSEFQNGAASMEVIHDGAVANRGAQTAAITVTAALQYAASMYVKAPVGAALQMWMIEYQSDGVTQVGSTTTQSYTGTGNWDLVTIAKTLTTGVRLRVSIRNTATVARTWYVDSVLVEQAASAGTYFPTTAQLASGEAGWTGTANASASDIGCFSSGTSRTLMGWVYRDATTNADVIFSAVTSDSSARSYLRLASGGTGVEWSWNNSPVTLTGAAIPAGAWTHWALVRTLNTGTVTFYVNGVEAYTGSPASPAVDMTGMTWTGLQFGVRAATSDPFDGKQAWVSVHQTALTATQIRDCYDTGKAQITLDGPIDSFTVESIPGQVPALPVLTLDDASTQARNIVEVGVQHDVDPDNLEPILLEAVTDLDALGGASSTRSGSHSTNIVRSALAPTPIAVCTAAGQPHKGRWKIRTRVYPSATTVLVRLAWRAGDGPFAKEKWVAVPNSAGWFDLDLGTVNIKELPSGHTCEFRIEAKSTSGSPTVDVDIVECIPADSYTKLRGSSASEVGTGAIVAMDDFSIQTAGAVTGKTPLLAPAGLYSGAGDADDFSVDTSAGGLITRTAVSDSALNNGRYLRAGSSTLAATIVSLDIYISGSVAIGTSRFGPMLRYIDTNNWLMVVFESTGSGQFNISLIKRVAGSETTLGSVPAGVLGGQWWRILVGADTSGSAVVYFGPGGTSDADPGPVMFVSGDSTLATAGAIASGGYGIYDAYTSATGLTRNYDNFTVSTLATSATIINPAINSGYGLDLKHNTALTDNATGTGQGTTPIREGQYLTLPPSTRNNSVHRIVTRARRNDGELGFADEGLDDALTASLEVTPRVHLTGT